MDLREAYLHVPVDILPAISQIQICGHALTILCHALRTFFRPQNFHEVGVSNGSHPQTLISLMLPRRHLSTFILPITGHSRHGVGDLRDPESRLFDQPRQKPVGPNHPSSPPRGSDRLFERAGFSFTRQGAQSSRHGVPGSGTEVGSPSSPIPTTGEDGLLLCHSALGLQAFPTTTVVPPIPMVEAQHVDAQGTTAITDSYVVSLVDISRPITRLLLSGTRLCCPDIGCEPSGSGCPPSQPGGSRLMVAVGK